MGLTDDEKLLEEFWKLISIYLNWTFSPIKIDPIKQTFSKRSKNLIDIFIQNFIYYLCIGITFLSNSCFFHKLLFGSFSNSKIAIIFEIIILIAMIQNTGFMITSFKELNQMFCNFEEIIRFKNMLSKLISFKEYSNIYYLNIINLKY